MHVSTRLKNACFKHQVLLIHTLLELAESNKRMSLSFPVVLIILWSLRNDDFRTTPPLGHVIVLRCRPVEI